MPIIIKQIQTTQWRSCRETETVWPAETCKYKLTHGPWGTLTRARFYNAITIGPNYGVSKLNGCVVKDWNTENEKKKQSTNKPCEEKKNTKLKCIWFFFYFFIYIFRWTTCWFIWPEEKTAPRLSLVSFFSPFCHRWSIGSIDLIAQILFKLKWAGWWHHWIQWWSAFNWKLSILILSFCIIDTLFPV